MKTARDIRLVVDDAPPGEYAIVDRPTQRGGGGQYEKIWRTVLHASDTGQAVFVAGARDNLNLTMALRARARISSPRLLLKTCARDVSRLYWVERA